jgi:cyclin H
MDYHPKHIMTAALFLATKTENHHSPLKHFVEKLNSIHGLNKLTADEVLAPEFILTQGLRFCFDVRHPHRGLKGFYLECKLLHQMLLGKKLPAGFTSWSDDKARTVVLAGNDRNPDEFLAGVDKGYGIAKDYLNRAALLSDVYFLYTPSQILFAAWYIAQPELITAYLTLKLANATDLAGKVTKAIDDCAKILRATDHGSQEDREEPMRIDKKLFKCRNPDKLDLVGLNKAQKRGGGEEGVLDENVAKKRKLAREKSEKEAADLFGPDLVKK